MPTSKKTIVSAPGKIILFGEHSVVYGQPAIALPVTQVSATCRLSYGEHQGVLIQMPDIDEETYLHEAPLDHPHAAAIREFVQRAPDIVPHLKGLCIELTSTIPIGRGLGSGAALAASLLRGMATHFDQPQLGTDAAISEMTYEIEKLHHGTPSGIDNTVVSYERPIFFVRDMFNSDRKTLEMLLDREGYYLFLPAVTPFLVNKRFNILIADTGITALTKKAVGDVRSDWMRNRLMVETYFMRAGEIAIEALQAIRTGEIETLGLLMNFNHKVLKLLNVSSEELDSLVSTALEAGAMGAKMSGGGRGGNMIALVSEETKADVSAALLQAGAKSVIDTFVA
ncbi:MAG: mevalonate kinase [Chloroflexota bacterium]